MQAHGDYTAAHETEPHVLTSAGHRPPTLPAPEPAAWSPIREWESAPQINGPDWNNFVQGETLPADNWKSGQDAQPGYQYSGISYWWDRFQSIRNINTLGYHIDGIDFIKSGISYWWNGFQ